MPGRVLIVDDSATNRRLMRARLGAAYYEVIEAGDGKQALALATEDPPDIVLLDLRLPGIDGFEICRLLKGARATAHLPIIMVTASDGRDDRLRGLEAGADDFLAKPFDNLTLISRIASLTRMKMMVDELTMHDNAGKQAGPGSDFLASLTATRFPEARILIVGDGDGVQGLGETITSATGARIETALAHDLMRMVTDTAPPDAVLIDGRMTGADPMRLGARLRAQAATRRTALLLIVPPDSARTRSGAMAARALEVGFDDYLVSPLDQAELIARLRLQLRRKIHADRLRTTMRDRMFHAITDPLTGLYNRRHANEHLDDIVNRCQDRGRALAVMILDLDHFKAINDGHGHGAGDMVLHEFAQRLRANLRGIDLIARIGGEEFLVVMPDSDATPTTEIAERVRHAIAEKPFPVSTAGETRPVTVSIGLAVMRPGESALELTARADRAVYASKHAGRNRATLDRAS